MLATMESFKKSIIRTLIVSSVFILALLYQSNVLAASLDNVDYSSLPGDRVQINLQFSEPLTEEPVNFTIDNPARIAIDLPDVTLNVDERSQTIGVGDVLGL
ncbi:MAG: AMIN domain-containing protein, partial [Gammaproteobacteria bacterium]|nr:AMIN domain-containing protein [Gammaproteobacteria bacterium]